MQRKPDRRLFEHVKQKHNSRVTANILTLISKSVGYGRANNFRASGQQSPTPTFVSLSHCPLITPITRMAPYNISMHGLIQAARDGLSELTWTTIVALFIFSCIATRLISGLQSRQRVDDPAEPRTSRLAPYWLPWIGHGISFLWDHVGLLGSLRFVSHTCHRSFATKC